MCIRDSDNTYDFDLAKAPQTIIKVIGVGGGGGNAVSNMSVSYTHLDVYKRQTFAVGQPGRYVDCNQLRLYRHHLER